MKSIPPRFTIYFFSTCLLYLVASEASTKITDRTSAKKPYRQNYNPIVLYTKPAPDKINTRRMFLVAKKYSIPPAPDKINTRTMSLIVKQSRIFPAPDAVKTQHMSLVSKKQLARPAPDRVKTQRMSLIAK